MGKVKKKLIWLQICEPCSKSPTGKHEFYVPAGLIGKWRAKLNLWFDKKGGEALTGYIKECPVCGSRENVRIIKILERKIQNGVDGKD